MESPMVTTGPKNFSGNPPRPSLRRLTPSCAPCSCAPRVLKVEVADTGVGMSEEGMKNIFTFFGKLKDVHSLNPSGSGLGLVICKQLCEQMKGSIGVHSVIKQGSTFWFTVQLEVISGSCSQHKSPPGSGAFACNTEHTSPASPSLMASLRLRSAVSSPQVPGPKFLPKEGDVGSSGNVSPSSVSSLVPLPNHFPRPYLRRDSNCIPSVASLATSLPLSSATSSTSSTASFVSSHSTSFPSVSPTAVSPNDSTKPSPGAPMAAINRPMFRHKLAPDLKLVTHSSPAPVLAPLHDPDISPINVPVLNRSGPSSPLSPRPSVTFTLPGLEGIRNDRSPMSSVAADKSKVPSPVHSSLDSPSSHEHVMSPSSPWVIQQRKLRFSRSGALQDSNCATPSIDENASLVDPYSPLVPAPPAPLGKRIKVLYVEDSDFNVAVMSAFLSASHDLTICRNGLEGFEEFKRSIYDSESGDASCSGSANGSKTSLYDVILMDCEMPVMNGYDSTRAIRSYESDQSLLRSPIIGLTAFAMSGDREKCLHAGMDDYLTKPVSKKTILDSIMRWSSVAKQVFKEDAENV